jgi:DNA invertase Pin-like site-specific DNA recombinase
LEFHLVAQADREPRPTGPKLTPEQQQEACDLVRSGVSLRQSAKQFGINHHTLIRYLRKREESESEEEDT